MNKHGFLDIWTELSKSAMSCTVSEFIILRLGKKKSHITSAQLKSTSQLKMRLHKKKKNLTF